MSTNNYKEHQQHFAHVATGCDGAKHSIGIDENGTAYSWGSNNSMGQLGRSSGKASQPHSVTILSDDNDGDTSSETTFVRGYVGGLGESGHSALLDSTQTKLYMAGCDRWQQLGLGSSSGGASGYTWTDGGRIWRSEFVFTKHLQEFMMETSGTAKIRDVSLGGDHTVVLSANRQDVYTFGKGGEGQLGVVGKPFVSAPVKSSKLSTNKNEPITAVCAIQHCSLTLDRTGTVMKEAGKCRKTESFQSSLNACIQRARNDGLLE